MLKKTIPLIAVFIISLSLLILRPTLAKTIKIKKQNKKNQELLQRLNKKLEKLELIDEQEVEKRVKIIEGILPSLKPVLNLMGSLEGLSDEEGVIFSGLDLNPGVIKDKQTKQQKKEEFTISFNIEGRLENITSFVAKLEKTTPLMKIKQMSLILPEDEESPIIKATFNVEVFYQPLPKVLGKVEASLPTLTTEEVKILQKVKAYRIYPQIKPTSFVGKENIFSLAED